MEEDNLMTQLIYEVKNFKLSCSDCQWIDSPMCFECDDPPLNYNWELSDERAKLITQNIIEIIKDHLINIKSELDENESTQNSD